MELISKAVKLAPVWESTIVARSLIVYMVLHILAIVLMAQEIRVWKRTSPTAIQA
ncbi:MAG: hypothetical protein ACYC5Y_13190 [Symbiobacteriia bacterium]